MRSFLVFDTATEACTVGLSRNEEVLSRKVSGIRHSDVILDMVGELLDQAGIGLTQIDAIAFGRGPGMFTGLRIGAGVAQGLAFANDLPVVPISTLATIAQSVNHSNVLATIDARMGQVYWALFQRDSNGIAVLAGDEILQSPSEIRIRDEDVYIAAGSGWDQYEPQLRDALPYQIKGGEPGVTPEAAAIVALAQRQFENGEFVSAVEAQPVYIRDDVARKQKTG